MLRIAARIVSRGWLNQHPDIYDENENLSKGRHFSVQTNYAHFNLAFVRFDEGYLRQVTCLVQSDENAITNL